MTLVEKKLQRGRVAFGSGEGTVGNLVLKIKSSLRDIQAELFIDIWKCRNLEPSSSKVWEFRLLLALPPSAPHLSPAPLSKPQSISPWHGKMSKTGYKMSSNFHCVFKWGDVVFNCAWCIKNVWKYWQKTRNRESGYWRRWEGNKYIFSFYKLFVLFNFLLLACVIFIKI